MVKGKKGVKVKEALVPSESPAGLYDLGVSFSDVSEGSQDGLEDSESKKRRIEDKLCEEAVLQTALVPLNNVTAVKEGSMDVDFSEFKEVPLARGNL